MVDEKGIDRFRFYYLRLLRMQGGDENQEENKEKEDHDPAPGKNGGNVPPGKFVLGKEVEICEERSRDGCEDGNKEH